jgi:hypothetical protein
MEHGWRVASEKRRPVMKEGLPAVVLTAHFFQKFLPILASTMDSTTQIQKRLHNYSK